jgi:hypothetical protein
VVQQNGTPGFLKRKYFNSNFVIPFREVANVCSVGGALNLDIEELKWENTSATIAAKSIKVQEKNRCAPDVNLRVWFLYKIFRNPDFVGRGKKSKNVVR